VQLALRADSPENDFWSGRSPSNRRTKFLVAGVAMASAGVIAINPVAPTLPDLQERAVQLSAFANPLTVLQETITKSFTNLNTLGTNIPAASTALTGALTNPAVLAQLVNLVTANATNPTAALTQLLNFQGTYGDQIATALQSSQTILQTNLANFPTIVQNTLGYLQTGQFVEAFSEVNIYFLVQLLERPGAPLFPLFRIPGDVAETLPGGQILANVLDAVLTRGIATGLTRALLVAPITSALFVAETLDHVQASLDAGDTETAISELVNAPLGLVNAFLNGYVPDFPSRSPFAGLLSPNGFFDYFLVDVPNAIATALNASTTTTATSRIATATAALAPTSPTDVGLGGDTVLLKLDAAADTAAVDTKAVSSDSTAEVVASDTPADDSGDGTVTAAATSEATEPAADDSAAGSTVNTDTDTKTDGDTKTDTDTDKTGSTTDKDMTDKESDKDESDHSKSSSSTTAKDKSGGDDSGDSGSDE